MVGLPLAKEWLSATTGEEGVRKEFNTQVLPPHLPGLAVETGLLPPHTSVTLLPLEAKKHKVIYSINVI